MLRRTQQDRWGTSFDSLSSSDRRRRTSISSTLSQPP
jgi:hypothetical protein